MTHTKDKKEEWEEIMTALLRGYFVTLIHYQYDIDNGVPNAQISYVEAEEYQTTKSKDFIRQTIQQERQQLIDEVVEKMQERKIVSIAKYGNMSAPHDPTYMDGYRKGFDDIITLLVEMKEV